MEPIADIFERLGGPARMADAIGVTIEHAAGMRRRRSIPVGYWPSIIAAPAAKGFEAVTYADLVAAHAHQRVSTGERARAQA